MTRALLLLALLALAFVNARLYAAADILDGWLTSSVLLFLAAGIGAAFTGAGRNS